MARKTVDQKCQAHYEANGYLVGKVERQTGKVKQDLFGFIDFIALDPRGARVIAIQCTSSQGGNLAARRRKITEHKNFKAVKKNMDIHLVGFHPDSDIPAKKEYL